jgi:hypothetical protein
MRGFTFIPMQTLDLQVTSQYMLIVGFTAHLLLLGAALMQMNVGGNNLMLLEGNKRDAQPRGIQPITSFRYYQHLESCLS